MILLKLAIALITICGFMFLAFVGTVLTIRNADDPQSRFLD